jgi:hypothetical protein
MSRPAVVIGAAVIVAATISLDGRIEGATPELNFAASFDEYCDTEYVPPPSSPARHVYFSGEVIYVRLSVGNAGPADRPFTFGATPLSRAFEIQVREAPAGAPSFGLSLASGGRLAVRGTLRESSWGEATNLPAGGELTFVAVLGASGPVVPGAYELRIVPRSPSGPLNLRATLLRFEFRNVDGAGRAEIARRRMAGALAHDATSQAGALARELLKIYPQSSSAYLVLGEVALREGAFEDAARHFSEARTLLNGADGLSIAHARAAVRQELENAVDRGGVRAGQRRDR